MFTNEELRMLIDGKMIGAYYPYDTGDEQAVLNYLKIIQAEFDRMPTLYCEAEPLHFGSGYASYVEWFIYTDQDSEISEANGIRTIEKKGLVVKISLLSPVILIGVGAKTIDIEIERDEEVSGSKDVFCEAWQLIIPEGFKDLLSTIERTFMKYQFTVLQKEDVTPQLPFQASIPTLFRKPGKYLIWDAIFYWED